MTVVSLPAFGKEASLPRLLPDLQATAQARGTHVPSRPSATGGRREGGFVFSSSMSASASAGAVESAAFPLGGPSSVRL
jgi:hypothetical protein